MSKDRIIEEIEDLKAILSWRTVSGPARTWWLSFELQNSERTDLLRELLVQLQKRNVSMSDFFLAYVYSGVDNIQTNLDYVDHVLLVVGERRPLTSADFAFKVT